MVSTDVASAHVVTAILVGLAVGSFVNVVVARLPERRSLLHPGSTCPGCGTAIAWHDNIPILSFAVLRGRCRACGMAISWRYPVVEAATATLWGLAWLEWGPTLDFAVAVLFLTALVAITAIDIGHQIIPDLITLPGIVAGFGANVATGRVHWLDSLLGIGVGGGIFLAIILASGGGMGGGDMKLGAMFGAFLGWKVALVALFVAVVLGGGFALVLLGTGRVRRKDPIPFGPFLAAGGAVGLFWGDKVMRWYLHRFAE
jgi:leader peptidase (prepilin peptidase)/N-methyltransferase